MATAVYRVVAGDGDWRVNNEKGELSWHYTKGAAVRIARALASSNVPSKVVVHRPDGTIESEWTYDDPGLLHG